MGNLTALLHLNFISINRPKEHGKLFEHRGTEHLFTGTGCIVYDVKVSRHPCRCIKCKKMAKKKDKETIKTFSVYIATATHVIYDDDEAKKMTIELNYNDDDRKDVKRMYGVSLCERSVEGDSCVLECVTCDEQLANDIKTNLENSNELYKKIFRRSDPIVVIISHPHGKPKHISFGNGKSLPIERDQLLSLTAYIYNASTCPGSSGAPVLLMNDCCTFRGTKLMLLNFQTNIIKKTTVRMVINEKQERPQEDHLIVPDSVEADLHRHYKPCEKNCAHTEFVPVDVFNITHLPVGCQDNDLVELVKCLGDLTVRVDVKMTSRDRPEFWPNTNEHYPFYDMRGFDVMRIGTGIIMLIRQIEDVQHPLCTCHRCQHSDTPSKVYFHIYMKTATHVVFDDVEARHTTARLFFDSQDSPLVTLDGLCVVDCDIVGDACYLKCVTCDVDLADKILKITQTVWDLYEKIEEEYKSENVAIILSHPHGCPKQVSVGHVVEDITLAEGYDIKLTKHSYTTCTCPGLSGAAVFMLSKDATPFIEKYITHHVHSDALEGGLNKCSWAADKFK